MAMIATIALFFVLDGKAKISFLEFNLFYTVAFVAIITFIWAIVSVVIVNTSLSHEEQTDWMHQNSNTLSDYITRMSQLEKRYVEISRKLDIPSATCGHYCDLTRLTLKMKSLLPSVFDLYLTKVKLEQIIGNCANMIDAMETNPAVNRQSIAINVNHFVDHSIDEIEIIKILTR